MLEEGLPSSTDPTRRKKSPAVAKTLRGDASFPSPLVLSYYYDPAVNRRENPILFTLPHDTGAIIMTMNSMFHWPTWRAAAHFYLGH